MRVFGAVLAGGASSRFGSDKALALYEGRALLHHASEALARFVDEVAVVGRGEIGDLPRPGLGPLGGIAGALAEGERRGFASVMTIACDMVRLPDGLVEALLRRAPSYCIDSPVLGHWPTGLAGILIDRLSSHDSSSRTCSGIPCSADVDADARAAPWTPGQARGDGADVKSGRHTRDPLLSIRRWAADIGAVAIPSPVPVANVNTPADLAAL